MVYKTSMERHKGASEYLEWVKTRRCARLNLAASGVVPCSLAELDTTGEQIEVNGPGLYGFAPLQQAIATHCRVTPECVVAASGTSMANFLVMAALVEPGDEVLIEYPVYQPLLSAAEFLGASIKRFPREASLRDFASDKTRLIVVTNLHNPTCRGFDSARLQDLGEAAISNGAHVLVDEVYLQCLYEKASSAFHLGRQFVSTASLTKAYGLGGLRCGWILAAPELAKRMWRIKDLIDPGSPHSTEQLSVIAFQKLNKLEARARRIIDANRSLVRDFLTSCPQLDLVLPDYGTCVFPRLKSGDSERLFEVLHTRYETDVVPGRFFEMPDHFRLGIGVDTAVLTEGLDRLGHALRDKSWV
jgi:aspartate/methionine/tyrosine aminotransferase